MSLDAIVSLNIIVSASAPAQANFGTPLIAAYHTHHTANRVLTYSTPADMVTDGWATTEPAYLAAVALKSQNPCPPTFKIGRRALAFTKVVHVFPQITTAGYVYSGTAYGQAWTYTVLGGASTASVTTALTAVFDALTTLTATEAGSTHAIVTAAAGILFDVVSTGSVKDDIKIYDKTTDPGIVTDLTAILLEDSNWYGLLLDSNSKAEVEAAAVSIEALRKIMVVQSGDADIRDGSVTTDLFSDLTTAAYKRTIPIFHHKPGSQWAAAAWLAGRLTSQPGSDTWAFKTLSGVDASSAKYLSEAEQANIVTKNGSYYATIGGLNVTFSGKNGAASYADIVRFTDWLYATVQSRVFFALASAPGKVPFTNSGIDVIVSAVQGVLNQGVKAGGFNGGDATTAAPTCTAPDVSAISATDRAARNLPGVAFSGVLAGAIHTVAISGTVSTS